MHPFQLQKKTLLIIFLVIATIYIIQTPTRTVFNLFYYPNPTKTIQCYHATSPTLPDISGAHPSKGKSIFFHETSCNSHFNGKITITARQACAVESAARLNPNFEVYLLFASDGVFHFEGTESDRFLEALLSYQNVRVHHVDYGRYTKGTPVEELYETGKIEASRFAQSHASDVLRYLSLWKYGGIYLDLDVIVTKPLETLPPNYAGAESERDVAAGVLSFSPDGLGHWFAQLCLVDLSQNFNGYDWGYNGPGVITRLLKKIYQVHEAQQMINNTRNDFTVFPKEAFYPIPWRDWEMYFDENQTQKVLNISENSYAVHVWNKLSENFKIDVMGNSAYATLARKFCPKVVGQCDGLF